MQFVFDIRPVGGGFEVHLLDGIKAPLVDGAGAPLVRPLALLDAAQEAVFARIVAQAPRDDDMVAFGQLLFGMLIGPEWWARIHDSAGFADLTIVCDLIPDLARLPWEMMALPDGRFVAQIPQVGIVRRVSGSTATFTPLTSPPTVLVVVGADLNRDVIRPAAECFALLNNLRSAEHPLHLRTHLLLNASPNRIRTAVSTYQPQVVHLVCHGQVDDQTRRGSLTLLSDQGAGITVEAYADLLLDILGAGAALPSIVVLSACYTAAPSLIEVGQIATPLAHELAARIPLVVGMSGAIGDQACRLFARRFYEALLADGAVGQASAEGRRAALTDAGTDPRRTVDWTMPIVCVAEGAGTAKVPVQPPQAATLAWKTQALEFVKRADVVFCDRVEVMDLYDLLMAPSPAQRRSRPNGEDLQVLTIQADENSEGHRYGRTRVLLELAAKAARDGHVPVILRALTMPWPKTRRTLLESIVEACRDTADTFGIDDPICRNLRLLLASGAAPIPDQADPALLKRFDTNQSSDRVDVLAFALQLDLVALLGLVRGARPDGDRADMRLLLLLDDVHLMDEAAMDLASGLLGAGGLRRARDEIRIAITYATQGGNPRAGESVALEAIKSVNEQMWVATTTLGVFRQPDEDQHAYERFLLYASHGKVKGLALRRDLPDFAESFWSSTRERIRGVPSLLPTEGPEIIRSVFQFVPVAFQILRPANDDELLREAAGLKR